MPHIARYTGTKHDTIGVASHRRRQAQIVFADAGHEPADEGYAAAVDREGRVFFGGRHSLCRRISIEAAESRVACAAAHQGLPPSEQLPVSFHD